MKQFKTPLAIKGTKEELEALIGPLKDLGYELNRGKYSGKYLVTNWVGSNVQLGFNNSPNLYQYKRIEVPAYNKDLVLALAAMVEGEEDIPIKGQWYYCHTSLVMDLDGWIAATKGQLYKSEENMAITNNSGLIHHWYPIESSYKKWFRKATVEEILNRFNQNNMKEGRGIVGYKLKNKELREAASYIAFGNSAWLPPERNDIITIDDVIERFKKVQVLNLWFEPVYEQEKKIIKVSHRDGVLEVEIKDNKAYCLDRIFNKNTLSKIIEPRSADATFFTPDTFTAGCSGKYKNISREDIQKVIDALN